jgi:hypothetical protein
VQAAFVDPPKLHRFVNQIAGWVIDASSIVIDTYEGDALAIWSDAPPAAVLRTRFDAFPGIAQKKAAMQSRSRNATSMSRLPTSQAATSPTARPP